MKITFLADSFLLDESTGVNGTQIQMYNLAQALSQRGLEVHYISLTRNRQKQTEIINGINLHWIQSGYKLFSWVSDVSAFYKVLGRIYPDIVYQRGRSHLTHAAGAWSERKQKKFIWASNGEDSCDFWKNIKRVGRSKRSFWKKWLLYPYFLPQDVLIHKGIRRASQVINQTEHQKKQLFKNYGKMGIILPSIFESNFSGAGEPKTKLCLWAATLSPNKQPGMFIELARHCVSLQEWKFLMIGDTQDLQYWNHLVKQASVLENIDMAGSVPFDQTNTYFDRASLFVNTSIVEGISNAMIQAWLHGIPVLSLNQDPNGWITGNRLGFCAKGDLRSFLSTGYRMLQDMAILEEIGKRCAEFAKNTFASDNIIEHYIKLLEQLSKNEDLFCNELSLQ